jgi:CRISPR-associated protein Cas2
MYLIMVYDVGVDRVTKVLKTGRKYLTHVQNSVLEGEITPNKFSRLQKELGEIIDKHHDTVMFYSFHSDKVLNKKRLGIATTDPNDTILE